MTTSSAPPRPTPAPRALDLTLNKVLAGAGAAATSAVLGSFFGAAGTVVGAALGSVASTVATVVYQHSLDRTQRTIAARFRPDRSGDGGTPDEPTPPEGEETSGEPTPADEDTGDVRPVPPPRRRPRWGMWIGATALVFALGLAAVTGIEWVKGSTLTTGQSGTSVSRVLTPSGDGDSPSSTPSATTTSAPSATATSTADPSATATPSSTSAPTASTQPSSTVAPTSGAVPGLSDLPDGTP